MNTKNALLVLAGLMLAWACAAFADMTMTWAGERQGVAKAAVAGDTESAEATDVVAAEEDEEEESSITREEYLATVAYVEGEAAVDELSRRMVEDMFGPSDDGVGSQYGDSTLPGGGDDGVLPGGVQMTRGGVSASRSAGGWTGSAADDSGNYAVDQNWIGENGGSGFGEWRAKDGSAPLAVSTISGDGGFIMQAGENPGETAMMRSLNTDVGLASGTFTVSMWGPEGGADEPGDFAGFAVYGANDTELFRWGFSLAEVEGEDDPISSYVYKGTGDNSYTVAFPGYAEPQIEVLYSLTWAQLTGGGTMRFTLSATEHPGGKEPDVHRFTETIDVATTEYVRAIAAVLTESGLYTQGGDGSEMTFDNLSVTGTEPTPTPAVPEPGTLGLLAAGLAALWRRMKRAA